MPSKTDEIIAAFEELLKRRGTQKPTDRLGLERPVVSRDFENKPMAGWEKAASLIGAAVSPVSTIASMVLAPPQEESLFDRQIKNPDGSYSYPKVSESVVPRAKKQVRNQMRPNPIVQAIQQHFKLGAAKDPANDLVHQKINDRNFLVHATRPKDVEKIRKSGAILPSGEHLPPEVLDDPSIKKMIAAGQLDLYRSPFSGKMTLESPGGGPRYKVDKNRLLTGEPAVGPHASPGVSTSRQMRVPALNEEKSYRFLLDPSAKKTFSTAEPGYGKAGFEEGGKPKGFDRHESEQRTYGMPYPVKPANRALTHDVPKLPTEESVAPNKVDQYRATMGNETFKTILERIAFKKPSRAEKLEKYNKLKADADSLYQKIMAPAGSFPAEEYEKLVDAWQKAYAAQNKAFDDLKY